MIKSLRNKFIIVTTSLMIIVFGGFLLVNTIYNSYWTEAEIVDMLDWIARSGIFTSEKMDSSSEDLILDMTEEERPITGIILDENGDCVLQRTIGTNLIVPVSNDILDRMSEKKGNGYLIKGYFYSYNELENGKVLIVTMDATKRADYWVRVFGVVLLVALGIMLLMAITFFLSKFVTAPAEQSLSREKRFIADASHELKTPIGAISINAQALELDYKDNLHVANIISECKRMSRLLERLLMLSKLDEAEVNRNEELSLSDICEEMILTYECMAYEKKVNLVYDVESGIEIKGNEDELRQLMAIMIDNAIKNTEEEGTINISCSKEKKHSLIEISNTGHGIAAEDLPHIFERFYTSDKSRKQSSFGLGLSIAQSIVEGHRGHIEVESEMGKLTVFKIYL